MGGIFPWLWGSHCGPPDRLYEYILAERKIEATHGWATADRRTAREVDRLSDDE